MVFVIVIRYFFVSHIIWILPFVSITTTLKILSVFFYLLKILFHNNISVKKLFHSLSSLSAHFCPVGGNEVMKKVDDKDL